MGTGATTVDALSSLSDPIVGLVAAIGVITGTVTSGLMHKQTRRQIALDAAKAAVIVGFLGAIWYVGLGAIGEPTQSTVRIALVGVAFAILGALVVRRILESS
jgi:hypothetical protein